MRRRTGSFLGAATGVALLASLVAGCDDGPPTRHADFSDSPSTRFSEYRGPYGPYYVRPSQRHFGTPPPDPALAIAAPDPTPDPLLEGGDAMTGEGPTSKRTEASTTLNQGFSYERRKVKPLTLPVATPYSMATPVPTPSGRRLRSLLPPSVPSTATVASVAGQPEAAEKRRQREEQTRRALLLSQPDAAPAPTPAPVSPTPAESPPGSTLAPTVPAAPSTP